MMCKAFIKVCVFHEVNGLHKGIYITCSFEPWLELTVRLINSLSSVLLGGVPTSVTISHFMLFLNLSEKLLLHGLITPPCFANTSCG